MNKLQKSLFPLFRLKAILLRYKVYATTEHYHLIHSTHVMSLYQNAETSIESAVSGRREVGVLEAPYS